MEEQHRSDLKRGLEATEGRLSNKGCRRSRQAEGWHKLGKPARRLFEHRLLLSRDSPSEAKVEGRKVEATGRGQVLTLRWGNTLGADGEFRLGEGQPWLRFLGKLPNGQCSPSKRLSHLLRRRKERDRAGCAR